MGSHRVHSFSILYTYNVHFLDDRCQESRHCMSFLMVKCEFCFVMHGLRVDPQLNFENTKCCLSRLATDLYSCCHYNYRDLPDIQYAATLFISAQHVNVLVAPSTKGIWIDIRVPFIETS